MERQDYNYLIMEKLGDHPTDQQLLLAGFSPLVNMSIFKKDIMDAIKRYPNSRFVQLLIWMQIDNPLDYDRFNEESKITYQRLH